MTQTVKMNELFSPAGLASQVLSFSFFRLFSVKSYNLKISQDSGYLLKAETLVRSRGYLLQLPLHIHCTTEMIKACTNLVLLRFPPYQLHFFLEPFLKGKHKMKLNDCSNQVGEVYVFQDFLKCETETEE